MRSNRLVRVLLVTVAVVAALITAGTVARELSWRQATAGAPEPDYLGDPASLDSLAMPSGYTESRQEFVDCSHTRISRCFITDESLEVAARQVQQVLGPTDIRMADYFGTRAAVLCGSLGPNSGPVIGKVVPIMTNARSNGPGSWSLPDHPRFDDRVAIMFQLVNHLSCEDA